MPRGTGIASEGQGSGFAWQGPRSTYDPVAAAKGAYNYAAAKQRADQMAKQKSLDSALKGIGTNGPKILDADMIGSVQKHRDKFWDDFSNRYRENGQLGDMDYFEAQRFKQEDESRNKMFADQRDALIKYTGTIQGGDPNKINKDAMSRNAAIYLQPSEYKNDPIYGSIISQTLDPIIDSLKQDDKYSTNGVVDEDWVKTDANSIWRAQYGRDMLMPVFTPTSLTENFNKNVLPLAGKYTESQKTGGAFGSEISNLIERRDGDNTEVEIGGQKFTIYGIKVAAGLNYAGDPEVRRSALENFASLNDKATQKQYMDSATGNTPEQKLQNASFNWYVNEYGGKLGQEAISKQGSKEGSASNYTINGKTFTTDYALSPTTTGLMTDRIGVGWDNQDTGETEKQSAKGEIQFNGWNVANKLGKPVRLTGNLGTVWDRALESHSTTDVPLEGNYIVDVTGYGVSPVTSQDIDLSAPEYKELRDALAGTITGTTGHEGSAIYNSLKKKNFKIKGGTPLTTNEERILYDWSKSHGKNMINSRAFVSGSVAAQDGTVDENAEISRDKYTIPGMLSPLVEYNSRLGTQMFKGKNTPYDQLKVGNAFGQILNPDGQPYPEYPDNYSAGDSQFIKSEKNGNTGGSSSKQTYAPNGKEYNTQDKYGYYMNGVAVDVK